MGAAMEGERQCQHMPEIAAHGSHTRWVRQSLGFQGYGDIANDSADADSDPDAEENHGLVPHRTGRHVVRPSEQVHDAPKKDRIEKLKARNYQISQCQKTRDPDVAAKKT